MLSQIKRRFRPRVGAVLCAVAGLAVLAAQGAQASDVPAAAKPAAYKATVRVDVSGPAIGHINAHYIGLSFESSTLDSPVNRYDQVGDLPQLLKNLGSGVMRFGGDSADLSSFTGTPPGTLAGLARLAAAANWPVLYTENLGDFNAAQVTADAKVVRAALGRHLFAFGCGNEPDQFVATGVRPPGYTVSDYIREAAQCLHAVQAGAPGASLEGPDATNTTALTHPYAAREAGHLTWFGQHYYPLGCAAPGDNPEALAATLLSPALAAQEARRFTSYAATAAAAHAPLLITETNSACRGGVAGLSNSYAAALWVIDYLLSGAEHGVHGMNLQTGLNSNCAGYTVFCQAAEFEYRAQPIYYGLLLTHLLGGGDFVPLKVTKSAKADDVVAFALRPVGGGLRLLLENLSTAKAKVTLHAGSYRGKATVLRLTAPALLATSGVRLQGASVAANGTIKPGPPNTVRCAQSACPVTIAPYSAAVLNFPKYLQPRYVKSSV